MPIPAKVRLPWGDKHITVAAFSDVAAVAYLGSRIGLYVSTCPVSGWQAAIQLHDEHGDVVGENLAYGHGKSPEEAVGDLQKDCERQLGKWAGILCAGD